MSAMVLTNNIVRRLNRKADTSSSFVRCTISLLTLKPTIDRNVVADDNAAATIPAKTTAPSNGGMRFMAAQIIAS